MPSVGYIVSFHSVHDTTEYNIGQQKQSIPRYLPFAHSFVNSLGLTNDLDYLNGCNSRFSRNNLDFNSACGVNYRFALLT